MAVRPDTDMKSGAPRPDSQEGELEQYGVWVKAEPQDIAPEPENAEGGRASSLGSEPRRQAAEEEFELPEIGEGLPEESFLSAEEERLLGSFEDIKLDEAEESLPPAAEGFLPREDFSLPDIEDLSSLTAESLSPLPEDKLADLSLTELESSAFPTEIGPNAEIDMSSLVGLDEEEAKKPETTREPPIEDVSAEFLDDVTAEFLGEEEEAATPPASRPLPAAGPAEFEPLDIELHFDDLPPSGQAGKPGESGFEELGEFDGMLAPEPAAAHDGSFDDLAALENELADSPVGREPAAKAQPAPLSAAPQSEAPSLANELLLQIATELSSIRAELVTLKSQLGQVRLQASASPAPAVSEGPALASIKEEEEAVGGFFDEEEDETIALTGDELDNILSSADFTEESAPEEAAIEGGESGPSFDLLPESGDYSLPADTPAIEEIRLEPETIEIEPPPPPAANEGFGEIGNLADEGFPPLTEAPEDTSYLEEPLGAEQPLDLGESPLVEAPLVEPDLSELIVEDVEAIDELEIGGELPAVEEEALPDLRLETPSPASSRLESGIEEEAEELEALAPIPEIEEFSLDEIKLAEEARHHEAEEAPAIEVPQEIQDLQLETFDKVAEENFEIPEDFVLGETEELPPAAAVLEEPRAVEAETEIEAEFEPEIEPEAVAAREPEIEIEPEAEEFLAEPELPKPASRREEGGSERLKSEIRSVLGYLDKLLESLPEDKIEEFAHSEHFETYKKLFEELGLV